jgi:aryl-alcohol dehydrogenase-like predicted oxidoreductase
MEYRKLGNSDLVVSVISLGTWLTYGGRIDLDAATAAVHHAFDLGINFFDTANVYGRGDSERFLGSVLAGHQRDSYFLATKVYWPMSETDRGLSKEQLLKQSEASLQRLGVDYVDLYQAHRYDEDTPLEETLEGFTEVVRLGRARYIGFSEWTPEQIEAALRLADTSGVERFVSSQPEYSMLWRKAEQVIPVCEANGVSQIVWSPLAQGALTGKYLPGEPPPEGSRAAGKDARMMGRFRDDEVLEAVQRLRPIADGLGLTLAQLALAWVLQPNNVASAIVGASRPEQLDDNVGAAGVILDDETMKAIDRALGPDVVGP